MRCLESSFVILEFIGWWWRESITLNICVCVSLRIYLGSGTLMQSARKLINTFTSSDDWGDLAICQILYQTYTVLTDASWPGSVNGTPKYEWGCKWWWTLPGLSQRQLILSKAHTTLAMLSSGCYLREDDTEVWESWTTGSRAASSH